jgi:heme oxygenase
MEHAEQKEKTPADLFMQELRAATDLMHKSLENNSVSRKLMSEDINLSDYAFYLRCMGEVMKCYDTIVLPAVSGVITDAEKREKSKDLEEDLEFLYRSGAEKRDTKPLVGFSGNPSLAYALGYAYVIEGSTLGGRVILKHIGKTLNLGEKGTKFFEGYGAETGRFWKTFLEAFTGNIIRNKTQNEAIQGAVDGFSDIGRHFANQE